jgi:hypothetical protein
MNLPKNLWDQWIPIICQGRYQTSILTIIDKKPIFSIYYTKFRVYSLFVTFIHKNRELQRRKNCTVERENAIFKSSPVDEYHLPQMNSEKVFFGCTEDNKRPI